ncbi:hypothetical protein [Flavobacterium sp.]
MLVKPEELKTELYDEVVDDITRGDSDEVVTQIKAAEDFCKSYLFKYDLKALFGDDTVEPVMAPTVVDENLKKCVKIIASYWLVRKVNPNANVDLFRDDYEMMIGTKTEPGWLTEVKEGYLSPAWPYAVDNPETPDVDESKSSEVSWSSNIKRNNYF